MNNAITMAKRKFPLLDKYISDDYTEKLNENTIIENSYTLPAMLLSDDEILYQINEALQKLDNKNGKVSSIIRGMKTSEIKMQNTLSEIALYMFFYNRGELIDYEYDYKIENKPKNMDLLIKVTNYEYLIDIINIEKVENNKLIESDFPLTGMVKNELNSIIRTKILNKAKTKGFEYLKDRGCNKKLGIAIEYSKNQELYIESIASLKFCPGLLKEFAEDIFSQNVLIDALIFYEYMPTYGRPLLAMNVKMFDRDFGEIINANNINLIR